MVILPCGYRLAAAAFDVDLAFRDVHDKDAAKGSRTRRKALDIGAPTLSQPTGNASTADENDCCTFVCDDCAGLEVKAKTGCLLMSRDDLERRLACAETLCDGLSQDATFFGSGRALHSDVAFRFAHDAVLRARHRNATRGSSTIVAG
jgi:hypothetical protein